ncbi:PIR Superfamily Protein [Plasmodium ovale wallikeri]|uniref:PIR Superfamily Protein n=1 Tax=Plasmodium ovale wallikeri TaxID=864142 RepID=A0A1A9AD37_PLAOA|nr:PIR Superfamily Protein [Plasmodium ovale wallikeri]SBT54079.1 PIR Superfamily Protein [Plasmodium ovale wallikeri]
MVDKVVCTKKQEFDASQLFSNLFLKSLHGKEYFENHIKQIEEYKLSNNSESIISTINNQFEKIFQEINDYFNNDEIRCCRNMNYYFDLLNSIIKSPKILSKEIQDNLTSKIEQNWRKIPKVNDKVNCKGETDLYSIQKRCILKHLQDLELDKQFIQVFPEDYKKYLSKKWEKIIGYTKPHYGGLYVKVENDSMGIIGPYDHILYSTDYICEDSLDKLSTDDITISTDMDSLINTISLEKISANNSKKECYNNTYIDMLKKKTQSIQRVNNLLSVGIGLLGFSLIILFLFRFSPLGNMIHRFTKQKVKVDENMNDEIHELYEEYENGRQYISYNSASH